MHPDPVAMTMDADSYMRVLAAFQAAGARLVYRRGVAVSWDHSGLPVAFTNRVEALNWLIRYWIPTRDGIVG